MSIVVKGDLEIKFKKGCYPTENDFKDLLDSYVHKDDILDISKIKQDIEGISVSLPEMLNTTKAEAVNLAKAYTDEVCRFVGIWDYKGSTRTELFLSNYSVDNPYNFKRGDWMVAYTTNTVGSYMYPRQRDYYVGGGFSAISSNDNIWNIANGDIFIYNEDGEWDLIHTDAVSNSTLLSALSTKVDVVAGKGLSTNDYTDAEKAKLAEIDNKVDVVAGKGLSTNDYTDAEKAKLAAIEITNPQVQSDWNQTDSSAVDYIKNKPQVLRQVTDIDNNAGVLGEIIQYIGENTEQFNTGDNLQLRERNESVPFIELGDLCVPYYTTRKQFIKDQSTSYPNASGVFKISNTIRCWRAGYYFKILNATEDGYTPTIGDNLYCYNPGGNVDVQEATITDIDTEELLFYTDIYNSAQSYSTDVIRIDPTLEDNAGNCYLQYYEIDFTEQVLQGDRLTLINLATLQIDDTLYYKIVPATSTINKEVTYREWQILNNIPNSPAEDGSYILTCTVTDGVAEYSWELQQ